MTRFTRRSVRLRDTSLDASSVRARRRRAARKRLERAYGCNSRLACSSMVRWQAGTVTAIRRRWHGAVEVDVAVPGATGAVRALAYPALVGEPEPGDRVLLNTGALALGLGTGGYALVVALPDRPPPEPQG